MLDYLRRRPTPPADLLEIIAEVRSRWRAKLVLRGVVRMAAVALALFLLAAYGLEWAKFTVASIIAARVLFAVALAASVFFFLIKPLRWKVSDEQVALYLEEHEPSLQATLISAIEASRRGETPLSPALVQRLVEQAIEACCADNMSRRVEEAPLRRWGVAAGRLGRRRRNARAAGPGRAPQRARRDPARVAQRRGGGALPHRGASRKRDGAEGRRPDDYGAAAGLRSRGCVAHGPPLAAGRVRAAAARAQ